MLLTLAQRAWFAWHCLPRTDKGQPPPVRSLERAHLLANAQLQKLIMGRSKRPSYGELVKMAMALDCDPAWLQSGEGIAPTTSYPVPAGPPQRAKLTGGSGLSPGDKVMFERKAKQLTDRPLARITKRTSK